MRSARRVRPAAFEIQQLGRRKHEQGVMWSGAYHLVRTSGVLGPPRRKCLRVVGRGDHHATCSVNRHPCGRPLSANTRRTSEGREAHHARPRAVTGRGTEGEQFVEQEQEDLMRSRGAGTLPPQPPGRTHEKTERCPGRLDTRGGGGTWKFHSNVVS